MYPMRFSNMRFGNNDPYDMSQNYGDSVEQGLMPPRFDPNATPEPEPEPIEVEQERPPNMWDAYRELIQRQQNGPALSEYRKYVESGAPKQEDHKPNKMTRLGAILSGGAAGWRNPSEGVEVATKIVRGPYEEALRQHGIKGGHLREAASLEESGFGKQLSLVNAMREAANQDADNKRADKTEARLDKASAARINNYLSQGYVRIPNDETGATELVKVMPGGEINRITIPKTQMSAKDKSTLQIKTANTIAENNEDRIRERQRIARNATFGQQNMSREDTQRHAMELARFRAQNDRTSPTQQVTSNSIAIDSLVRTNPNKYANVYQYNDEQQVFEIVNPLADIGTDLDNLTSEQKDEYNAFVEIHNMLAKGMPDSVMLNPLDSKYEELPPSDPPPNSPFLDNPRNFRPHNFSDPFKLPPLYNPGKK